MYRHVAVMYRSRWITVLLDPCLTPHYGHCTFFLSPPICLKVQNPGVTVFQTASHVASDPLGGSEFGACPSSKR